MPCQHLRGLLKKKTATVVVSLEEWGPSIKGGRVPQRSSMEFFHKDIILQIFFSPLYLPLSWLKYFFSIVVRLEMAKNALWKRQFAFDIWLGELFVKTCVEAKR